MGRVAGNIDGLRGFVDANCIAECAGQLVVSPRTIEELAAVARFANNNKLAIEIAGAGTKRGWGNPVAAEIVLKTTELAVVRHHSWQDLTATVGAGTPWAAMQRALGAHNQQVALDPLWPETATVGGIVASNDSGALRLRYGGLRDIIIGMTIVLADGTIAKSGGKVVKNVAGYDLHKLMIGALGTLGVITEVTFRLHPIPVQTATWTIASMESEPVGELMLNVLDSQFCTQAMQIRSNAEGHALDVGLATLPEVLTQQTAALDRLAAGVAARNRSCFGAPLHGSADPFAAREELFASPGGVVLKATMLPSCVAQVAAHVVRLGGSAVTQATGIMFARFSDEAAIHALPSLYAYVDTAGDGELTVLRAPQRPLPIWATPPWGAERVPALMREIKRRFDPNRALNPGRFLGGI
jgi:glycolate oxidase FAD binding subunit